MGKASDEQQSGTETIGFKNPITQLGWAKIDHILTFDPTLSDGAYRTYAMLIYHAQQEAETYVSVAKVANERDLRRETISAHIKELEEHGLITRIEREGTSSLTQIEELPKVYQDMAAVVLNARGSLLGKSNTPCAKNLTQERIEEEKKSESSEPKANVYAAYSDAFKTLLQERSYAVLGYIEELETFPQEWILEAFRRTLRREKAGDAVWSAAQRLPYALRILDEWKQAKRILPERTPKPIQARPAAPVAGRTWDQMTVYD